MAHTKEALPTFYSKTTSPSLFFYELHTRQQPRHGEIYFPQRKKNKMLEGNKGREFPIAGFRPSNLGILRRKHLRHEWHMNAFDSLIEDLIKHV